MIAAFFFITMSVMLIIIPSCSNKGRKTITHQAVTSLNEFQAQVKKIEQHGTSASWYLSELIALSEHKNQQKIFDTIARLQQYKPNTTHALAFLETTIHLHDSYHHNNNKQLDLATFLWLNETEGCSITIHSYYPTLHKTWINFTLRINQHKNPRTHNNDILLTVVNCSQHKKPIEHETSIIIEPANPHALFSEELREDIVTYLQTGYLHDDIGLTIITDNNRSIVAESKEQKMLTITINLKKIAINAPMLHFSILECIQKFL